MAPLSAGRGSMVRQAIRILVHHPAIAGTVGFPDGLEDVEMPGIPLLIELLNDLQENPCPNTGALLERWRGRPHHESLSRLATSDFQVDAQGAAKELAGALQQLFPHRLERRLAELMSKKSQGSLNEAERLELQGLLTSR
jgi:DNA primase